MAQVVDNKYRVIRQIGAGGMGSVFEAEHTGVGRRVALKVMHPSLKEKDPSTLSRLQREARLAGSLDSPHIAEVYDTGVDGATGSPYLVMEYLVGEDLQSLLARSPTLPQTLALKITAQVCRGLRKAHEAKVIHRDIKPANIFLANKDEEIIVKVLDFGIAKLKADELSSLDQAALTRTGSLVGSPLFMSPEQARGSKTIDQRADIWSVGVVMFNMLTGRTPYDDIDALGELILAICSTVSPSVRDYAPEVSRAVAQIVTKSLTILPEDRFQTVAELYDALLPHAGGTHRIEPSMLVGLPERAQTSAGHPPQSSRLVGKSQPNSPYSSARTQILEDSAPKASPLPHLSDAADIGSSPLVDRPPSPAAFSVDGAALEPRFDPGTTGPKLADSQAPTASTLTSARPRAPSSVPPTEKRRTAWYVGGAAAITFGGLAAYFVQGSTPPKPTSGGENIASPSGTPTLEITAAPSSSASPEAPTSASTSASPAASASSSSSTAASPVASATSSPTERPKVGGAIRPPSTAKTVDTNGFGDRK